MCKAWYVRYDSKTQRVCVYESKTKKLVASVDAEDVEAVSPSTLDEISRYFGFGENDEVILREIEWEIYTTYTDR